MASRNRPRVSSRRFQESPRNEKVTPGERVRTIIQAAVNRPPEAATVERVRSLAGAVSRLWRKLANAPSPSTPERREHSHQVAGFGLKIARLMGLEEDCAERIFLAGFLHDVGSVAVQESIWLKPGCLTAEERAGMQVHSLIGYELLRGLLPTEGLAGIALSHHERFDGQGYPNGLSGTKIPLEARVLAIADSMDAMLSPRPYRNPIPASAALEELMRGAGRQFDSSIVEDLVWKGKSIAWSPNG